ncbi:sigma-54-dependent Fis family transcriptional regulator [Desulfotalea psychrophila]|uniref:Related to sigma54-dependent transcriptional regulator n=1 Tax=Desulfotalea psychrophila (strain LSv54 / DSM 12343) TaxID=177439 RepID=Q6AR13_DESPS|nr:sigma-54-dependent Fis family transcriptional regulator [Desulfotalea psychrophila]CAG35211.1 related to sigma54-dependent transcriptional regulator [Desulfotalea psychrophila LSv54]
MANIIPIGSIPTKEQMQRVIRASHKRSRQYGVNQETRNLEQKRLSPAELEKKQDENKELLGAIAATINEFYDLMSPEEFLVGFADSEGYILHLAGGDRARETSADRQFSLGYRWTEKDVGTTATSLCLRLKVSIQLKGRDHYCKQAQGLLSSAAPIFGHQGVLLGSLCIFGDKSLIHPHTLIMITSSARSIERHMRLMRWNTELISNAGFLDNVIEAAGTGLLIIDTDLIVQKINYQAKKILNVDDLKGKSISSLSGLQLDLDSIFENPSVWKNRECHIQHNKKDIHLVYSAQPVLSKNDKPLGAVLNITKFSNIRKLIDKISGIKPYFTFDSLIGSSPAFTKAVDLAKRASHSEATVLLLGETGTGKELFAQAIHNGAKGADKPFVPINCGAIPGELLESELFGYAEGAFTGAKRGGRSGKFILANDGTMLLDEIGDMPHDMQVKLLRVLQSKVVQPVGARKPLQTNARIIASTHVDLAEAMLHNRFRRDLYYRLNILQIKIPPLRERGEVDIKALAHYFLRKNNPEFQFTADAIAGLVAYHWPGNVRELENTIQRALHVCKDQTITVKDLGLSKQDLSKKAGFQGTLLDMEKKVIAETLRETKSNMAEAARRLGISRATLYRKVKQFS